MPPCHLAGETAVQRFTNADAECSLDSTGAKKQGERSRSTTALAAAADDDVMAIRHSQFREASTEESAESPVQPNRSSR